MSDTEFRDFPHDWPRFGVGQIDNQEAWAWQEQQNQERMKPTIPQLEAAYDAAAQQLQRLVAERNTLTVEWEQHARALKGDDPAAFALAQQRMAAIAVRAAPLDLDVARAADERQRRQNLLIQARAELEEIKAARRSLRPQGGHVAHGLGRLQAMSEDLRLKRLQDTLEGR